MAFFHYIWPEDVRVFARKTDAVYWNKGCYRSSTVPGYSSMKMIRCPPTAIFVLRFGESTLGESNPTSSQTRHYHKVLAASRSTSALWFGMQESTLLLMWPSLNMVRHYTILRGNWLALRFVQNTVIMVRLGGVLSTDIYRQHYSGQ